MSEIKQSNTKNKKTTKSKENKIVSKKKNIILVTIVFALIAIIAIISIILSAKIGKKNDGSRENTKIENKVEVNVSKKVNSTKQIDDLKIENIQVKKENGVSYIYADVINTGKNQQGNIDVYISMLDDKGNEIIGFGDILPLINPGEKSTLNIGSTDDFVNAYECKIIKVQEDKK